MTDLPAESAPSHLWFLKSTELFSEMSETLVGSAGRLLEEMEFKKGDVLHLIEDGARFIYIVSEGQVKLRSVSEAGKERILDVAGPGDVFGPLDRLLPISPASPAASLSESGLAKEAVACSGGCALRFELAEFQSLVARRPAVVVNIYRLLGIKQRRLEIRLSRLLFRSSLGKVAGLLAELAERYGEKNSGGEVELDFRITHQEIASMIGVKRETVSECLAALELDEFIRTKNRRIVVLKTEELDEVV
ncbi:MAG: Crp/Fnr family transcriptional regulator [Sumerlaeia bacterium]